MSIFFNKQL